jgi:aldehyde dehydrogenase (NAD+)
MMATMGVFGLTGQACAAGSRLLVERSIHDQMVQGISAFAGGLPMGDPMGRGSMLGPLVSEVQKARVQAVIETAQAEGATLVKAVNVPDELNEGGYFIGPHVFTDVTPEMSLWKNEVFGPVLAITPFDTEAEALALANQTEYGLAAGIWTSDRDRIDRMTRRLDAGLVWVNTYGSLPVSVPFGGFKQSGWGKEGGRDALMGYSRVKSVVIQGS